MEPLFKSLVRDALQKARAKHGRQLTPHESYAVLLEEVDEFWDLVRSYSGSDPPHIRLSCLISMLEELSQIGAMAQRAAEDVILPRLEALNCQHDSVKVEFRARD